MYETVYVCVAEAKMPTFHTHSCAHPLPLPSSRILHSLRLSNKNLFIGYQDPYNKQLVLLSTLGHEQNEIVSHCGR